MKSRTRKSCVTVKLEHTFAAVFLCQVPSQSHVLLFCLDKQSVEYKKILSYQRDKVGPKTTNTSKTQDSIQPLSSSLAHLIPLESRCCFYTFVLLQI